jgi:hypothetical protein
LGSRAHYLGGKYLRISWVQKGSNGWTTIATVRAYSRRRVEHMAVEPCASHPRHLLAYNLTRVLNTFGVAPIMAAVRA